MTKYKGDIYIVFQSTKKGNNALWRVLPHQLENVDTSKYNVAKSHTDTIDQDELQFKPLPQSTKLSAIPIVNKQNGYDYSKIPSQDINAIRASYESIDYDKLNEYRELYEIAARCAVCQNLDKFNYNIFKYYFENVV